MHSMVQCSVIDDFAFCTENAIYEPPVEPNQHAVKVNFFHNFTNTDANLRSLYTEGPTLIYGLEHNGRHVKC
jgi:hypothetical protein